MATRTRKTERERIADFERDQSDAIDAGIRVNKSNNFPLPPTSVRLSEPLLQALDRVAASEHRGRSNLIQHILWKYLFDNKLFPERKGD
jgi:hypothetical protein